MHPMFRNKLAENAKNSIFFIPNQKCKWWCLSYWIIGLWKKIHPSKVKMHFYSDESVQCPYARRVFWNVCGFKIQESVQAQIYKPQFQSGPNSPTDPSLHFYLDELKPFSRCFWSTTILSEKKHIDILRFIWYENIGKEL